MMLQDIAFLPFLASNTFKILYCLNSLVELKASGPLHVLKLWTGVIKVILFIKIVL